MDFGAIISRAARIAWQYKVLWVLGFLVALGSGNSFSANQLFSYSNPAPSDVQGFQDLFVDPSLILGGIAALLCVLAILSIVFKIIALIAQGSLIAGVQQVEAEGGTSFSRAWSVGAARFWRILGLNILLFLPVIIVVGVIALVVGGSIAAGIAAGAASRGNDNSAGAIVGLLGGSLTLLCVLICVAVIYGLIASALQTFGERAIVIDNLGVMDSLSRAWAVFKKNLGNIIVLALLMGVISFVVGIVTSLISTIIFMPTILTAMNEARNGLAPITIALGAVSFIVVVILASIVSALFVAFNSAAWTLAYRQFVSPALPPVPPPVPPPAPLPIN